MLFNESINIDSNNQTNGVGVCVDEIWSFGGGFNA